MQNVASSLSCIHNVCHVVQKNKSLPFSFLMFIPRHRKIIVPIGPEAKEFLIRYCDIEFINQL